MSGRLRRLWVEMTTKDFQETDMSGVIAVLPVAAGTEAAPRVIPAVTERKILRRFILLKEVYHL